MKEHTSFIVIILVLVGGFGLLATQGSGGTPANPSTKAATTSKPPARAAAQSPMTKGNANAKVSLIQYSDFLCPSCTYFTTQIMPVIEQKYIETGKVNFEFRPMAFIAEGSNISGEGSYCAIDQTKFWDYHDAIYNYVWVNAFSKGVDPKTNTILTAPIVNEAASQAGLDGALFSDCLSSHKYASRIKSVTDTANSQGVTSTPYIMVNGQPLNGNLSLKTVETLIESQL